MLLCHSNSDAWLSLVERCVRDAEAAGSNPVASILGRGAGKPVFAGFPVFFLFGAGGCGCLACPGKCRVLTFVLTNFSDFS